MVLLPILVLYNYPYAYENVYGSWWNDRHELFTRSIEFCGVFVAGVTLALKSWLRFPQRHTRTNLYFVFPLLIYVGIRGAMLPQAQAQVADVQRQIQEARLAAQNEKEEEARQQQAAQEQEYISAMTGCSRALMFSVKLDPSRMRAELSDCLSNLHRMTGTYSATESQAATVMADVLRKQIGFLDAYAQTAAVWNNSPQLSAQGLNTSGDIDAREQLVSDMQAETTAIYRNAMTYLEAVPRDSKYAMTADNLAAIRTFSAQLATTFAQDRAMLDFFRANFGHWQIQGGKLILDSEALLGQYQALLDTMTKTSH
jgi:hypothetical protein